MWILTLCPNQAEAQCTANISITSPIICTGGTATVTIAASGGTAPYSFTFNSQTNTTGIFTGISAGAAQPYSVTDALGCGPVTGTIDITQPSPTTITLTSAAGTNTQALCAGTPITNITYSIGGTGTGATVTAGALPAGVTGSYSAGVYTISGTPTASGSFNFTITTTGPCTQATATGSFTVYAKPTLVITNPAPACAPSTVSITPAAVTAGSTLASGSLSYWTNAAATVSLPNPGSISVSGTYYIKVTTPSGCVDIKPVSATINPIPTVNALAAQNHCNGTAVPVTTFSGPVTGTTFTWTNSNTAIGLSASGTGNIPAFTATNTTGSTISATITVTPAANGCTGTPSTFTIAVKPTATVNAITSQTFCSGATVPAVALSGPLSGTSYTWTNNAPSIGLAASGSGNIPSFTAANASTSPVTATITVTPAANGCTGTPLSFTLTVNPVPTVTNASSLTICSGTGTGISLTSNIASDFSWTLGTVTGGITGASAGSGSTIDQILTNPGTLAGFAEYAITPVSITGTCTGAPYTITVNVNKAPEITQQPLDFQDVCDKSYVDFTATATGVPAPSIQWQVSTNNGSSWTNLVNSGTLVTGATASLLTIYATNSMTNNLYRAVFTNSCGTAASTTSELSVTDGVFINVDPVQDGGCVGGPVTLTAKANSHKNITGQWQYFDGTTWVNIGPLFGPANGNLTMTYTFTPSSTQNGMLFRAAMTGNCGGQISTAAVLTLSSIVSTTNACLGNGPVTFTNSGTPGGTWTVSGGGSITDSGVFTPSTPGCYTATYTTPTPFCTDTKSFIVFPAAPAMAPVANSCSSALSGITPVADVADFTAEYAVQAPGGTMSAYGSLAAANALLTNTPGCWTIKSRYKLTAACGTNPANSTSSVVSCQESTINAVVFPAAPSISAPSNTCFSSFTLPSLPAVQGFIAQWSIDGGSFTASPVVPSNPGGHTIAASYALASGCGSSAAGTLGTGSCSGTPLSVIIFPAAPAAPTVTPGFGLFTVTPPPAVTGFAAEYSFDDGSTWGANNPPTADNCQGYKIKVRYVTDAAFGPYPAGTSAPAGCADESPATLRVVDTTAPSLLCKVSGNQYVGANGGTTYLHSGLGWDATALDLCSLPTLTAALSGATTATGIGTLNGVIFNEGITTVTWTAADACGNSFDCTFTVEVNAAADLSITKTASPANAVTGQTLTYILKVTNNGPASALFVEITDLVPGLGSPQVTADTITGPWVSWSSPYDAGTLASGDISTLYIRGIVDVNQCSAIVNTASVTSTTRDDTPGNNSVSLSTNVSDLTSPTFDAPAGPVEFGVNNLISAIYVAGSLNKAPEPDYFLFKSGNTALDLNPGTMNFSDNCTSAGQLVINWRIDFAQTPDPSSPSNWLTFSSISGTGQPSAYGTDMVFPGDGVNYAIITHTVTYWLTDANGNRSIDRSGSIRIKPRPKLVKNTNP